MDYMQKRFETKNSFINLIILKQFRMELAQELEYSKYFGQNFYIRGRMHILNQLLSLINGSEGIAN
ncbi:unnamed protein product [Paramecium sonneborni]|uniref:Uncharacterized protein n=1 Tax=Paramecium sonneborni TaxID=65129 RepID=A0A8S1KXV3_9CILI|nr:unnamed protein product [Paramecium sonneborni]